MLGNLARLDELKAIRGPARHRAHRGLCPGVRATPCKEPGVGSIGVAGGISFNVFKTIHVRRRRDGGHGPEDLYRKLFPFHDQGHMPLRNGSEVGARSMLGLNFRMTELSGAGPRRADAQAGPDPRDAAGEQDPSQGADLRAAGGRRSRSCRTPRGHRHPTSWSSSPRAEVARAVTTDLKSRVLSDSGWHIYTQMEHTPLAADRVQQGIAHVNCTQFYPGRSSTGRACCPRPTTSSAAPCPSVSASPTRTSALPSA